MYTIEYTLNDLLCQARKLQIEIEVLENVNILNMQFHGLGAKKNDFNRENIFQTVYTTIIAKIFLRSVLIRYLVSK